MTFFTSSDKISCGLIVLQLSLCLSVVFTDQHQNSSREYSQCPERETECNLQKKIFLRNQRELICTDSFLIFGVIDSVSICCVHKCLTSAARLRDCLLWLVVMLLYCIIYMYFERLTRKYCSLMQCWVCLTNSNWNCCNDK